MGIINLMQKKEQEMQSTIVDNTSTNEEQTTSTNDDSEEVKDHKDTNDRKTIVLQGPLSHIYTQALNMTYANEDIASSILIAGPMKKIEAESSYVDSSGQDIESGATEPSEHDMYVYCCDSDIEQEGLVNVVNSVSRASMEGYKNVMIAIECNGRVSSKIGLIEDLSKQLGVRVYYSRNSALEGIDERVRGS